MMKRFPVGRFFSFLLLIGLITSSCSRSAPPPAPLAIGDFSALFDKVFIKAKPEIKDQARQIVSLVQAQDYAKAFFQLQEFSTKPGLDKEQNVAIARGSITLNNLLQEAQAKGDAKAADAVKLYHDTK